MSAKPVAPSSSKKTKRSSRPYHHGDLRASLIAAALRLIDERGVKGFSLTDAARIAGVSVAAPYRHFSDKQALLTAIATQGFEAFSTALKAAFDQAPSPETQIIELGVAYVLFAHRNPAYVRVMFTVNTGIDSPPDSSNPDGFALLSKAVAQVAPNASRQERIDRVVASWSIVHGFALLSLDGAFRATLGLTDPEPQLRRSLKLLLPQVASHVSSSQTAKKSIQSRLTSKVATPKPLS